ncbi:hypothetical protein NQZ79_g6123 [Umbelopsis isabellina]|nr:hypothetical protein NQZ79_g6123 [Umbelopsis isabellina]
MLGGTEEILQPLWSCCSLPNRLGKNLVNKIVIQHRLVTSEVLRQRLATSSKTCLKMSFEQTPHKTSFDCRELAATSTMCAFFAHRTRLDVGLLRSASPNVLFCGLEPSHPAFPSSSVDLLQAFSSSVP